MPYMIAVSLEMSDEPDKSYEFLGVSTVINFRFHA